MLGRLFLSFAIFGFCGFAQAADLPARSAPLPIPPLFTWSGIYVGVHAGYAWGHDSSNLPVLAYGSSLSPDGVVGGGQIGYNYQVQQFVVGVEGEVDGSSYSKSAYDPVTATTFSSSLPVEGSVRGRVGVAVDRALIYATGGLALAHEKTSYAPAGFSASRGLTGWTVGGGIEYAMTDRWSMRGEYRFTEFEHANDTLIPAPTVTHQQVQHAVRVGVDYKFEMYAPPPPVVAKY